MTIKGKGRTRPRQVAKAPRREPVVVKPRLWRRTWVQLTGTFVLGILATVLVMVVVNRLRTEGDNSDQAAKSARKTTMLSGWQAAVDGAFGTVGNVNQNKPPDVLPDLVSTLKKLLSGTVPDGAAATLDQEAGLAATAADQLEGFKAPDEIRAASAFDRFETLRILDAQDGFTLTLRLYARSAILAAAAARAEGVQIKSLADQAEELRKLASSTLESAYGGYEELLIQAGLISLVPPAATVPVGG